VFLFCQGKRREKGGKKKRAVQRKEKEGDLARLSSPLFTALDYGKGEEGKKGEEGVEEEKKRKKKEDEEKRICS